MTDAIYLTPEEIEKLHKARLTGTMAEIRDRFVIGCVTGLRYSDYSRFGPGHIKNGIISILTQKKNRRVEIPVHRYVAEILRRNKNDLPMAATLRYFNMMLPRIGSKAGIRELVNTEHLELTQTDEINARDLIEGIQPTTVRKVVRGKIPKCELITTHTARRSFATNAYLAGIPAAKIMLITGHTTESSFFRYIRIAASQNAKELNDHEFFK